MLLSQIRNLNTYPSMAQTETYEDIKRTNDIDKSYQRHVINIGDVIMKTVVIEQKK